MIQFSEDNKALKLWETEGPKGKKRLALDGDNTEVVYNPQSGLISPTSGYVQYTGDSYKTTLGEAKSKEQERLNKNYSVVLEKQSQILEEEIKNGNFTSEKFTDWWNAVKKGDYKKALRFIPKELLKQIPYMASNYFTAGFGTVVTEGGNMYQDILKTEAANYLNKEEKDITGNDMLSYIDKFGNEGFEKAMAGGGLISLVEAAGINLMVSKGKYMRNALKEILEKDFKQAMKQVGNNTLRAGGAATGEALTEGIQTGIEQGVVGKFDHKEYIESMGSGGLIGVVLPTGGAMIGQSINTINDIGKSILLSDADTKANLKQINQYFKSAEQKIDNDFKAGKITVEQKYESIENLSITRNTASKIKKKLKLKKQLKEKMIR
jgi:DNA-binding ferritin-like protein (Dps family)